jgi:hypothetical protein
MLSGDSISYADIWSLLLERIARTAKKESLISITSPFPYYRDEPVHVRLISTHESPSLMADSTRVPLREDVQLDDVWHATVWPSTKGWHTLKVNGENLEYFVADDGAWRSLSIANQMKANSLASRNEDQPKMFSSERKKISPLLFYALFLIAAGFLWLVPKL